MYVLADGLDRFLSTYNPAEAERPKGKFTSDGAGTLANTLNIASAPTIIRIAAGLGVTALPVIGAVMVRDPYARSAFSGAAIGAGISTFKTFWNNVVMGMWLKPKDTSPASLQKSFIARLYPAEVAAAINMGNKQTSVASTGSGALSAPPAAQAAGVGAPADVGPFALSGDSPYPDAQQALRAGLHGDSPYPSTEQAFLRGDSPYPSASQALGAPAGHGNPGQPGLSDWTPGPPPGTGPGPKAEPRTDPSCGCIGEDNPYLGFVGDAQEDDSFFMPN